MSERKKHTEAIVAPVEAEPGAKEIRVEKKTLIFLVGLPGSGKSTFAMDHFPLDSIVSTDRIRGEFTNNPRNALVSEKAFILAVRLAEERLNNDGVVVVDAQNLRGEMRNYFYKALERTGANATAIFLNVSPEESVRRDAARNRQVGERYIKSRANLHKAAEHSLRKDKYIDEVVVLDPDEIENVKIVLPESEQKAFEADRELLQEAGEAERYLAVSETGFLKREQERGVDTFEIKAGSVLFVEDGEKSRELMSKNFLPDQIVDAEEFARRMNTGTSDRAVRDVVRYVVRQRIANNLTTVVLYPDDFHKIDSIHEKIQEAEEERGITIDKPMLSAEDVEKYEYVRVMREAEESGPLFLVGDVHGCYTAMRELASRVRKENIAKEKGEEIGPARQIIFVGDMADRGPYDAKTVMYITALVRSGRATLVRGNHDDNLLQGLKGGEVKSQDTRKTLEELKKRLKPASLQRIIDMLEAAPFYAEWKDLVVAHASLPRIPRRDEPLTGREKHIMTHGARSGAMVGGRVEVYKLPQTVAHDPETMIVGGHTHEEKPVQDAQSGTVILDGSVEERGLLWGMYFPEMDFVSAEQPEIIEFYELLQQSELPKGEALLDFVEKARKQSFVRTKQGEGEYEGLTIINYSRVTELGSLWEKFPVLRNFRGMIIDTKGEIIGRPFKKTHKAGIEIPMEELTMIPDKVFEKANGSMGIVYHWNGKWRVATKFSFENQGYTVPATRMLERLNADALDTNKTHLFEIILPEDSHIVDYGGKEDLVLLNSIDTKTGEEDTWDEVSATSASLGARTADDMTDQFEGMSIAEVYAYAQTPGTLPNMEGLMAQYVNEEGEKVTVKVKVREYDEKKFVRDRLDWKKIFDRIDFRTMTLSEEDRNWLLGYNYDNAFVIAALDTRLEWLQAEKERIVSEARALLDPIMKRVQVSYQEAVDGGEDPRKALSRILNPVSREVIGLLRGRGEEIGKHTLNKYITYIRSFVTQGSKSISQVEKIVFKEIKKKIEDETKRRGQASYWLLPRE